MKEKEYYNEISNIIETIEINSRVRELQDNSEKLQGYWNIGRLIVEAQGGLLRASYGNGLINEWSINFTDKYGKNYSSRELRRMRQFYLLYPKWCSLSTISWTHYRYLLSLKNINERNYYTNMILLNNLSVRELKTEIKNKSFDRLSYANKNNIKLIKSKNYTLSIKDMIKDPILIKANSNISNLDEKTLHKYIIEMLEDKFIELGIGLALVGHEYKISAEGHRYSLDLLFFNIKLNCYVVIELKTRTMRISDYDQIVFYTSLVDKHVRDRNHNKTIGILIAKEKDKYIIKYATSKDIFTSTYQLLN